MWKAEPKKKTKQGTIQEMWKKNLQTTREMHGLNKSKFGQIAIVALLGPQLQTSFQGYLKNTASTKRRN
jgi:hypothetical protein